MAPQRENAGKNNWLKIKTISTKSNRTGLGARVTVAGHSQTQTVLGQASYYSHDDLRLHYGLGSQSTAEQVTVHWPSGLVDRLKNVAANQVITLRACTKTLSDKLPACRGLRFARIPKRPTSWQLVGQGFSYTL